ncbi:MAG: NAD(P)H-hydrate dehydratase [Acidimicrobiia bacterium]
MRPVITPAEATRLDQASTVAVDVLMERAGRAVALAAVGMGASYGAKVAVLAGPGNNGGDGYVAARMLRQRGVGVEAHAFGDPRTRPALAAMGRARSSGVSIKELGKPHHVDLVIDALFGGGFRSGVPSSLIDWMEWEGPVLAVDLPSGLDPATGEVTENAFHASRTVTFHALKVGQVIGVGPDVCGSITVADIGLEGGEPELLVTEESDAPLPGRSRTSHKWSAGSVLVVGGARGMTGAAVLAARAALNFGAGAVGLAVPEEASMIAASAAPELLHYSLDGLPARYDVLVIGPGLGSELAEWAAGLIAAWEGLVVVDADALAGLAPDRPLTRYGAVLTPHAGEFRRLAGEEATYWAAADIATTMEATVLLKGNPTFVTNGEVPWLVSTGGPELATIGTGDVLAGMVGALLAAGLDPPTAARSAAYWHGRAGSALSASRTVTAAGLLDQIGRWR